MAKQIIHKLVDDLDGGDADETVKFALDGIQYEIDLSKKNADKLRDAIRAVRRRAAPRSAAAASWSAAGRRAGGAVPPPTASRTRRSGPGPRRKGKDISDRGRIPQEIVDEYHAKAGR